MSTESAREDLVQADRAAAQREGTVPGSTESGPELFFTDKRRLGRSIIVDGKPLAIQGRPYALPQCARSAFAASAIPDGMPFMLEADASYPKGINAFLRALPTLGCPSRHTWRGYAYDLKTFCHFLAQQPGAPTLETASGEHINRYKAVRAVIDAGDTPRSIAGKVTPSTWNRGIAALDKFYAYAATRDPSIQVPFTYKDVGSRFRGGFRQTRRNNALSREGDKGVVRCISLFEYGQFRDHGLLGWPARAGSSAFRGRNGLRNAAFAETLVTTGVRLEEGASIMLAELPQPDDPRYAGLRSCPLQLGRLTTKGDKGRRIWLPMRVLREHIIPYVEEDRDNAVGKAVDLGTYRDLVDPVLIARWTARDCVLAGSNVRLPYDRLDHAFRSRMVGIGHDQRVDEPAMLWLSEQGLPLHPSTFDAVFARACTRLREEGGLDLHVTPHTLRHTYAVYMLAHLVRGIVERLPNLRSEKGRVTPNAYTALVMDPLRRLQRLLGHASIETTQVYLTFVEEADELVDEAIGSWGDRLGHPVELPDTDAADG